MRVGSESIAGLDSDVIKGDVGQSGITGGEGGKVTEVLEEADERVLVVIVHMGDDASLRSCFLGGRVGHGLIRWCCVVLRVHIWKH